MWVNVGIISAELALIMFGRTNISPPALSADRSYQKGGYVSSSTEAFRKSILEKEGKTDVELKEEKFFCEANEERLKLFCTEDETPFCIICHDSAAHSGHSFTPLKKAVTMCKEKLKTATDALELKLKYITELQLKQEGKISYIQLLSMLQANILKMPKKVPSPLTLDPDTAYPYLILSEDLTSVRDDDVIQHLPDNPKRFDCYISVLGKEGFNSERHYWEVEVKNKTEWDVGVTRESSNRKREFEMNAKHGYWMMMLRNKNEYTAEDSSLKNVTHTVKPQRIGVYLDYEGGEVSLYNADNMSHIYTYTDKFTETIYPYFSPGLNYKGENSELLKLFHLKL
ncbi:zinc-binding protein A33-like [Protopterus annectens]|uniref:zinc-binding protein A33-like n=1 Tax=Protopterus annectens TaxID=7888 RepID=UPI001CFB4A05|nr:zinc-binding protein A33-like [Protopterus annectens]